MSNIKDILTGIYDSYCWGKDQKTGELEDKAIGTIQIKTEKKKNFFKK